MPRNFLCSLGNWLDVDGAAFGYLALQPRQEASPGRAVLIQCQRVYGFGLGGMQEGAELDDVDAVFAVVVMRVAAAPTHAAVPCRGNTRSARCRRLAGCPASAVQMRRSRPRSEVSVVMTQCPILCAQPSLCRLGQ